MSNQLYFAINILMRRIMDYLRWLKVVCLSEVLLDQQSANINTPLNLKSCHCVQAPRNHGV